MPHSSRTGRSYRKVAGAVDVVAELAVEKQCVTLNDVIAAIAAERDRRIDIQSGTLGVGVCGELRRFDDHDTIVIAEDLPDRLRTLAHELGHVIFNHEGRRIDDSLLAADSDLIAYMLSARTVSPSGGLEEFGADELAEWEAETFANMLLERLKVLGTGPDRLARLRFDEALG